MAEQVQRQIGAATVIVAELNALDHLFQRELRLGAQRHIRRAQIDRVRAI